MSDASARVAVQRLLDDAGLRLDGDRDCDPRLHDARLPARLLAGGSLVLGESYVEGAWDCPALDEFFFRLLRAGLDQRVHSAGALAAALRARLLNPQTIPRIRRSVQRHYDIGNDLYQAMLDRRMIYSCAWWENAETLDAAQEAKLELCCRKLMLRPGLRLLDIGCGWGGLARWAAERHGVEVVGVTVSEHQAELGRARCRGLPVEIRLEDYRHVRGDFDRVVSVGMFEHVGHRNHRDFFRAARARLKEDGLLLLHTIGSNRTVLHNDPWIDRHVFPDSLLPSAAQVTAALEGLFVLEDWHSFGPHYDRTLMAWHANIEAAWPRLDARYDERFRRMWRFYLLSCAGSFRARHNQLWQLVLSPAGLPGGFRVPR